MKYTLLLFVSQWVLIENKKVSYTHQYLSRTETCFLNHRHFPRKCHNGLHSIKRARQTAAFSFIMKPCPPRGSFLCPVMGAPSHIPGRPDGPGDEDSPPPPPEYAAQGSQDTPPFSASQYSRTGAPLATKPPFPFVNRRLPLRSPGQRRPPAGLARRTGCCTGGAGSPQSGR